MPDPRRPCLDTAAFDGAALDLDGVVTRTSAVHSTAWKRLFDAFLAQREGARFRPFDIGADYVRYVDGKPRSAGVRDFLASRGIVLPEGAPDDPPERDSVLALGRRKNALFRESLAQHGVHVFEGAVAFLRRLRKAGIRTALVSSSENALSVLSVAGLDDLFDASVDGLEAKRLGLAGKPAPDTFLHAARVLGIAPARMLGVEDALAGVIAIRAAGFGLAIGVDRDGRADQLRASGAGMVVGDLGDVEIRDAHAPASWTALPPAVLPLTPTTDPDWCVREDGFALTREHEIESLFATGNGNLGTRGSLPEGSRLSAPATYVAGVYGAGPGGSVERVVAPDWTALSIAIEGEPLQLQAGRVLEHRRILDLRQATLFREWRQQDAAGRIACIRAFRLASAADRRVVAQSVAFAPENFSASVTFDAHVAPAATMPTHTGAAVALAARTRLSDIGGAAPRVHAFEDVHGLDAHLGMAYRVDRIAAVHTSRDPGDPAVLARGHVGQVDDAGLQKLVDDHVQAWRDHWEACDVRIDGDPRLQRALRFAIYHLLSAANPDDARVSIGARGMTGPAYHGHVFWDTDIFMLPFFIHARPAIARALLGYRHATLPAARRRAAQHGCRGALYAWESADTGDDVTPPMVIQPNGEATPVLTGTQEVHIAADVAYATSHYCRATGDVEFLRDAGAEILVETARFWASRARLGGDGHFHIDGVVGPDEYHETVDDNAYTNGMAQWNLDAAADAVDLLARHWPRHREALAERLHLDAAEPDHWRDVARAMYTGLDEATGLIEQFRGYFDLEDLDLAQFEPRNAPMDVLLGRERLQRTQIIKQADVVMLLHLLWDRVPASVREKNFRYYERRCGHGSSLSPSIHALVAARVGDKRTAARLLQQAMDIDLSHAGNAAGGVHMGALGGLWQAVVFGFAGLRFADGGPVLEPSMPDHWRRIAFPIAWQGRRYDLEAGP